MNTLIKFILMLSLHVVVYTSPYDNGKYNPIKYNINDDGKYYRPLNEGKYTPGNEGRYTYVYIQGLYPVDDGDYAYVHQVGPNGGFGGNGGEGGKGSGGPDGQGGTGGPGGSGARNQYVGKRIYAENFPYIDNNIKSLIDEYVSYDFLTFEGSSNHFSEVSGNKGVAVKCKCLDPEQKQEELVTQDPPRMHIKKGEYPGSFYSIKGTKTLNNIPNAPMKKLKLEYELLVRVYEDISEASENI